MWSCVRGSWFTCTDIDINSNKRYVRVHIHSKQNRYLTNHRIVLYAANAEYWGITIIFTSHVKNVPYKPVIHLHYR